MEQRFLTEEGLPNQEPARLTQQETLSAAQEETALPDGNRLDPNVVDDLMRQLSEAEGSHAHPRWMLPQERESLLRRLTQQAYSQKRRRQWFQIVYAIGGALFIGFNLAFISGYIKYLPSLMPPLVICYTVAAFCMALAGRRWGRAAQRIAHFDDLRASGPLMEALELREQTVVAAAENALSRLLPRLKASDAELITEAQRECLYRRLKIQHAPTEAEFQIVALRALEQIGDTNALSCVEALAASTNMTANATRVREAAQQCLASLKEQAEQKQNHDNLLRASSGLNVPSNALLRPAVDSPHAGPDQLLRSSEL